MTALLVLGLVSAIQGVLCESIPTSCDVDSNTKTRDEVKRFECGKSGLATPTEQFSIGGKLAASPGDFPWSAAVYIRRSSEWNQVCGGTLISSQAVLTAACCVTTFELLAFPKISNVTDVSVVLGKTNLMWEVNEPTAIKCQIKEIRVHPMYVGSSLNYFNDIALLLLDSEVPFSSVVMPACLDYNHNQVPLYKNDVIGYVSGFGYTNECGSACSNKSEKLMYTRTQVLDYVQCYDKIRTISGSPVVRLTPDKICIGNGTVSPIQIGDGGSGLTLISQGLHYVMGVASVKLISSSGARYSFGTLTNVSEHMDWIIKSLPQ